MALIQKVRAYLDPITGSHLSEHALGVGNPVGVNLTFALRCSNEELITGSSGLEPIHRIVHRPAGRVPDRIGANSRTKRIVGQAIARDGLRVGGSVI